MTLLELQEIINTARRQGATDNTQVFSAEDANAISSLEDKPWAAREDFYIHDAEYLPADDILAIYC